MPIRTLTPADASAYVALRREMLADSPWAFAASLEDDRGIDPAQVATMLHDPMHAVVGAFDDESRLCGVAGLTRPRHVKMAHRAHIWGVYVTPRARGQGLGSAIMRVALERARAWPGVTSASLSVSVRSAAARAMYERLGFQAWGVEPGCLVLDGTAIDEVHMVAELA